MKSVKLRVGNIIAASNDYGQTFYKLEIVTSVNPRERPEFRVSFKSPDGELCACGNEEIELADNNLIITYQSGGDYYLVA